MSLGTDGLTRTLAKSLDVFLKHTHPECFTTDNVKLPTIVHRYIDTSFESPIEATVTFPHHGLGVYMFTIADGWHKISGF